MGRSRGEPLLERGEVDSPQDRSTHAFSLARLCLPPLWPGCIPVAPPPHFIHCLPRLSPFPPQIAGGTGARGVRRPPCPCLHRTFPGRSGRDSLLAWTRTPRRPTASRIFPPASELGGVRGGGEGGWRGRGRGEGGSHRHPWADERARARAAEGGVDGEGEGDGGGSGEGSMG